MKRKENDLNHPPPGNYVPAVNLQGSIPKIPNVALASCRGWSSGSPEQLWTQLSLIIGTCEVTLSPMEVENYPKWKETQYCRDPFSTEPWLWEGPGSSMTISWTHPSFCFLVQPIVTKKKGGELLRNFKKQTRWTSTPNSGNQDGGNWWNLGCECFGPVCTKIPSSFSRFYTKRNIFIY